MKYLAVIIICFSFLSCNKNQIYKETNKEFMANRWLKMDKQVFEARIANISIPYNVYFNFGHVYEFQFEEIPIVIDITSPSGKTETKKILLQILDENKKDIGDCLGDLCDIKYTIAQNHTFLEQGIYTYTITHKFSNVFLPNVLAVGIEIEKSE